MSRRIECDCAVIGGGISGLMAAKRITDKSPETKVVLIEQGGALDERSCPIVGGRSDSCVRCSSCSIMEGIAGAGAFSDGKYVISTEYGGWLTDFLPPAVVMDYIEQADSILVGFGATTERFAPSDRLKRLCLQHDLHMSQAYLKHLGTDENFSTMQRMVEDLEKKCEILTHTRAEDVDPKTHVIRCRTTDGELEIRSDCIIFAVGRAGSSFFREWCRAAGIPLVNNQVDLGVRVELPAPIWDEFSREIYEPKIWYRSKQYGDVTRMFCFNDRGSVVTENTGGVLTVNGHAYRDKAKKTENSNFALLSTIRFTKPFDDPIAYARHVAQLANLISGNSVLVQRLGDLRSGRRTDSSRLQQSTTHPTLNAVPGDLSLCLPKRQLDNIIETLDALAEVAPGTNNYDTLLYGVECKYYSARPRAHDFELEGCRSIYATGDGAGFTRSLSQAAANGLYVADLILKKHL